MESYRLLPDLTMSGQIVFDIRGFNVAYSHIQRKGGKQNGKGKSLNPY